MKNLIFVLITYCIASIIGFIFKLDNMFAEKVVMLVTLAKIYDLEDKLDTK